MVFYQLLIYISLLLLSCSHQVNSLQRSKNDNIIDPVIMPPYRLILKNNHISLPDSLGGKNAHGYVYIKLVINENKKIIQSTIMKLFIINNQEKINYDISEGYLPYELNSYADYLDTYCKENIIIEKNDEVKPERENIMYIKIKIE